VLRSGKGKNKQHISSVLKVVSCPFFMGKKDMMKALHYGKYIEIIKEQTEHFLI